MKDAKVRLYVDHPLGPGQSVALNVDQAHYLFSVMRLTPGAALRLFNGRNGEWLAEIGQAGKRKGALTITHQTAPQLDPPDLWLLFAPLKKTQTDFVVEKAVELGAARIQPVLTDFTNSERVRTDRLAARAREAAEQCGATYVPQIAEPAKLDRLLANWPADRALVFCDEAQAGRSPGPPAFFADTGEKAGNGRPAPPAAILIGPEGGFSDTERARIAALPQARAIALGPRILRAETAAIAALTLWQAGQGDW